MDPGAFFLASHGGNILGFTCRRPHSDENPANFVVDIVSVDQPVSVRSTGARSLPGGVANIIAGQDMARSGTLDHPSGCPCPSSRSPA